MHKRTIKLCTVKGFAFKSPGVNKLNFVAIGTYGIHYLNFIDKYELYVEFNYIPQSTVASIPIGRYTKGK